MGLLPYQSIELDILRLAMNGDQEQGYPTSLPLLQERLRPWTESSDGREIIACLRTLHEEKQVTLWKWQGQWIKFLRGNTDAEFFYAGQFNIRSTPRTIRRLQILEKNNTDKEKQGRKALKTDGQQLAFVAEVRLIELRQLSSAQFDFRKLIRLCEELNSSYASGNFCATAMLTRALLDHVPPLFQKGTFKEVANQYGGSSFKAAMLHLENGARKIADMILHSPIQNTESLPSEQQVHFAPQLDVLLAEVIRIKP